MRISVRRAIATLFVGLASPASADCIEEGYAARDRLRAGGAYQFELKIDDRRFECGRVVTEQAAHTYPCLGQNAPEEVIKIGGRAWTKDELGWKPADAAPSTPASQPRWALRPSFRVQCQGDAQLEGQIVKKYHFDFDDGSIEALYVDPRSGAAVRFDAGSSKSGFSRSISYVWDPSITILPPDAPSQAERREIALRQFSLAIQSSDPACRRRALATWAKARQSAFEFEVSSSVAHAGSTVGVFAPPSSVHIRHGSTEFISIDDRRWIVSRGKVIRRHDQANDDLMEYLNPNEDQVGMARCVGSGIVSGKQYDVVAIDIYKAGEDGALRRSFEMKLFLEPGTGLPERVERQSGYMSIVETRRYRSVLRVSPPAE